MSNVESTAAVVLGRGCNGSDDRRPTATEPQALGVQIVTAGASGALAWFAIASDRAILRRSLLTSLLVGTALTVINHGAALLAGSLHVTMAWQIVLTFLLPFLVSTVSSVAAIRASHANAGLCTRSHPPGGTDGG